MAQKRKFYVVWEGRQPGIYDNWQDASDQILNFPGAKYRSYSSIEAATEAFRTGDGVAEADMARFLIFAAEKQPKKKQQSTIPADVEVGAWAVDAACSGNPGKMEYQCVDIHSGKQIFHMGPFPEGTNNIGEYLAIVHALALLAQTGDKRTIYSDSRTALSWINRRHSNTKIKPSALNAPLLNLLQRADNWVASHVWQNRIIKWDTDNWGEIPADFGRK
jgi:ribonuclease HI